ncbi:hypothetical protein BBF96_00325 [Anoxybacter fermentans]|uniref:Peptidase M20 dimerisation domain-containing protein n=1 Tax=Anoxybacter fermentans TaxID=1323375 RepID=A0A3S9SUJ5_9FIRM|nr:M20 family metallopeptidase [Anoxybacter fermentans]AZR71983.1 hypothetical protein BBF96_00325 [Anoxybacter fermentans]
MKNLEKKIEELAAAIEKELIALRRDFHQNPELGFEEIETSRKVAAYLEKLGIEIKTGVGRTGVVGILQGDSPGPVIAFRADMDALPVTEKTGVEYASKIPGKMHACGHDGHTAILLATARVLSQLKSELKGTVKFIFQPAEEGPGGALPMIEDGVLTDPDVDAIFGLHLWPGFKVGEIGVGYGAIMAAPDQFTLKIRGRGGHGSAPHEAVDAITVAAQVINGLQHIISRQIAPTQPVVVTIGTIKGGYRHNIIADEVEMTGTVRTLSPAVRDEVPERMEEIIKGITSGFGADYELEYTKLYPPVINDQKMVDLVKEVANKVLGPDGVKIIKEPSMGGEDFSFYLEKVSGAFFRLGCSSGPETSYPLHHPKFNIDEKALLYGVKLFCNLAFSF